MNKETTGVFIKRLQNIIEEINTAIWESEDKYFSLREARNSIENTLEAVQS